ncbi:MAG: VOC family protein, partial [Planctomycetota bacterium]
MFVWCDLSAYRPAQAQAFYADVLGWEIEPDDYAMARADGAPVAALFDMPTKFRDMKMPSFWMSYIAVPSVADTV